MKSKGTAWALTTLTGILLSSQALGQSTLDIHSQHDINIWEHRDSSQDMQELSNEMLRYAQTAQQQRLEQERIRNQQRIDEERLRIQQEYQRELIEIEREKLKMQQEKQAESERNSKSSSIY